MIRRASPIEVPHPTWRPKPIWRRLGGASRAREMASPVYMQAGHPIINTGKVAISADCCCVTEDPCPFLLYLWASAKTNGGLYTVVLNEGTAQEYAFPGNSNTDTASTCSGRAWICVPDPGAAPPPIDLCTITGYVNGLHLNCCGTMIGGCCAEDVMIPPAFIHCDGGADHGAGTWPATGYDRDTLNGDPDHDCPIFLKGSTTAPCNDPAHGGAPPDGFDAVGDCMGDIQISYINGAGNHIIPGDCNTLHFHPAGHNDSGWGGAYVNSFITPISKDQYGNWWWYDNNHFDACRSANIYGWGGNGMLTDGVTGIGTFLPVACAPNIII